MRVLLIDIEGMALDFALRCSSAGHDVRWFKYVEKGKNPTRDGEGFKGIKIVDNWRENMPWAKEGLILITGNYKFIPELDRYREFGYKIFAPSQRSAELEIKRSIGMKAMEAAGIAVPPYHEFKSLEEARDFAKKSDECWVFKTMGDEEDKSLSYVSCNPAELVDWIQQKIDRGMKLKGPCMLQEKIDMLVELGVSGWFGSDGFLPNKWQECYEHKKLMDGEVGPQTGEMGTVCQYTSHSKIADELLLPMEPILKVLGHRGDFAVGAGIDTKGRAWPFEFTSRCGWPAFFIQTASHTGDPCQWMVDALNGQDTLKVSEKVAIGVVMGQPMFPYGKSSPEMVEGNPICGAEEVIDHVHFASVILEKGSSWEGKKIVSRPIFKTSGEYVLVATGLGSTICRAREAVYKTVKSIKFPNAMYRQDIGKKLEKPLPKLHDFGYALTTEYE